MAMDSPEGLATVTTLVAECLALRPETIAPSSRLLNDLGASSLDFIDLLFMLERRFGVQLQEDEFEYLSKVDASAPEALRDGVLPAETVRKLSRWIPALAQLAEPAQVTAGQLFSMVTVETLWLLVRSKLAENR